MTAIRSLPAWPSLARFLAGVAIIAAMVWGPALYGKLTSGSRLAPGLESAGGPVNVRVELSFRPQSFHREQLAEYGIFGGIRGNSVVLFNVSPAGLGHLDDLYWVDAIAPFRR
jgi:hypothetical protein